jgi:hypothetical protein
MNKKEYQIWKEIKYDEYLLHRHIFSFEKQLRFQGKIVLNYVVHDSDEAYKTFQELEVKNKPDNKDKEVIESILYDNKNHQFWNNKDLYREDYLDASYYEYLLVKEDGKYIISYDEHNIKLWS